MFSSSKQHSEQTSPTSTAGFSWFAEASSGWTCLLCCGHQGIAELWRRIKMEFTVELPMLKQRWKILLFGIIMQYVHGIFTQLAHRMHRPQEKPLHDVGFDLTPELGPDKFWVSEAIFGTLFAMFVLWTFTPFVTQRKRFYTVVMWSRLLMVLVSCQALRITTFTVTQLPGPSFHCRAGEATASRPWPDHWTGHVVVDVQRQATKSCGDLIFSSHTTFMLTGILAYTQYGSWVQMKWTAWICGAIVSCLIVASRKHYTVDIVIAWYTVPLVFYALYRRWTTVRPMTTEFLGALGENDEPDPQDSDVERGEMLTTGMSTSMSMAESKAPLSQPKERNYLQPSWMQPPPPLQQQQQQPQQQPSQQQQQTEMAHWGMQMGGENGGGGGGDVPSNGKMAVRTRSGFDDAAGKAEERQCRIS